MTELEFGAGDRPVWTPDGKSILFHTGGRRVRYLDLMTKSVRDVYRKSGGFVACEGLSVSPDEKWLLFSRFKWPESELLLAENFR